MARRISDEERIINYFTLEDDAKVEVVFNLISAIVKRRNKAAQGSRPQQRKDKTKKAQPEIVSTQ